jgi:hypothetical protein
MARTQLAQARSSGWTLIGTGRWPHMPKFQPGDFVKAEFQDAVNGGSERMWVQVVFCDDEAASCSGGSTTSSCWARLSTWATSLP